MNSSHTWTVTAKCSIKRQPCNFLYLDRDLGYKVYAYIKTHQIVHLKFVHFTVYIIFATKK